MSMLDSIFCVVLAGTFSVFSGACSSTPERPDQKMGSQQSKIANNDDVAAGQNGKNMKQYDLNHDNKPDVWAYFEPMADPADPSKTHESLVRKEWDFNFDGKVDIRRYFNFKRETVKDELDLDFDGRFDVTTYYKINMKVRQEYDFNFDSKPDYWKFFEKDKVVRTERDRDFNGRVDRWEYYVDGKLDRVGLDEDGDGQIDKWLQEENSEQ